MKRTPSSILLTLALVLAACGSDDGAVTVSNAWARASAPGQVQGAVYFDLTVDDDDILIGASVDPSVAAGAEIHEVVAADMGSDDGTDESMDDMSMSEGSDDMDADTGDDMGAMRMQELENGLELVAGEKVSFEPGGYHVMMPALTTPLVVGDEFDVTLDFANADDVTVTVEVAESAP